MESNKSADQDRTTTTTSRANDASAGVIDFLHLLGELKHLKRTGWILKRVPDAMQESVADHMYRMAVSAMLLEQQQQSDQHTNALPPLDVNKCIRMALIHDMAEAIVGDLTPSCGVEADEKRRRETSAMRQMCALITRSESAVDDDAFYRLHDEYQRHESREARTTKDLDMLDMLLQAFSLERCGHLSTPAADEFFAGCPRVRFSHPILCRWFDQLISDRDAFLRSAKP